MTLRSPDMVSVNQKVAQVFDDALDVPSDRRAAWLETTYASQPEIIQRVLALLEGDRAGRDLFRDLEAQRSELLGAFLGDSDRSDRDPRIGSTYGPWQVVAHLRSGGLAEVYEVRRADGRYDQRGALKILRAGILGGHAQSLFLRERRLLANLDHPGIVRIIDGGETLTGAPWLVMELVEGKSIDSHFLDNRCTTAEKLGLLAEAADILSAAHASLIVHGDLKAEHIIVNQLGRVRILDFGIAQALDEQGLGGSAAGFSPGYASPEQESGHGLTAASDIHQLGQVIAQVADDAAKSLPLSAVIAKATALLPAERYTSIAGLAADLRAITDDRAVVAAPDNRLQAFARMVRHNRIAASLAGVALVGSAGWATTATLSSAAIEKQRMLAVAAADRERRGKEVLLGLFRRADLLEADSLGLEPSAAAAMLDETLATARPALADDPALLADLLDWTARAHQRAGDPAKARGYAEEATTLIASSPLKGSMRDGAAMAFLAHVLASAGESERAGQMADRALATIGNADQADPLAADLLVSVAWSKEGKFAEQGALFERALAMSERLGEEKREIEIRSGLARALADRGEFPSARAQIARAIDLVSKYYGERHPRMALPLSDLGRIEEKAGNSAAAVEAHRRALAISNAAFGPRHGSTLSHRNNLAIALAADGQESAAIREYDLLVNAMPDGLPRGEIAQNYAVILLAAGRFDRAESLLSIAERNFAEHLPKDHPRRVFPALTRSEMRLSQQRLTEALGDARSALDQLESTLPAGHFATETARCRVGIALAGMGKPKEAAPYLRRALTALEDAGQSVPLRYLQPCRDAAGKL